MTLWKKVALGVVIVAIGIQFATVDHTNPPVIADLQVAPDLKASLRRACYDCHSNETSWPWYSRVAPVSWLLHADVIKGREALNFSAWESMPLEERSNKQRESGEEVAEGEMPPWYYTMMHPGAFSSLDRQRIQAWAAQAGGSHERDDGANRD